MLGRTFLLLLLVFATPLCAQGSGLIKLLEEYRGKYAALAKDDIAGRRELAKWCGSKRLRQRERFLNEEIVRLAPGDETARKALGHIKDGANWYDSNDALQRARGQRPRLRDWAPEADVAALTLVHGRYLTSEEVGKLDQGEPLEGHKLAEGAEVLTREHRIVSALDLARTLELARVLEQAVRQWRDAAGLEFAAARRHTLDIRILKTNDAFVAMIKDDIESFDQELCKAQGFFDGEQCWLSYFHDWYRTRRMLLHEARHQFDARIAGNIHRMPGWYMEGIAEYWSTHTWDGKKLTTGVLNASDNENLYYAVKMAKSGKLKGAETTLLNPWMETISPAFYQNSWALVYFLRTGKDHSDGFKKWEADLLAGKFASPQDQLAGFKKHVTADLKAFDKAYRGFIKGMEEQVPGKWK